MPPITSHQISAHGLSVSVTNYGASLHDLRLTDHNQPLILGFSDPSDYAHHHSHMGATAGRYANRISPAEITIDGKHHLLDANENGTTILHGGAQGCGTRLWQLVHHDKTSITFRLIEEDGHMGFPGKVEIEACYEVTAHQTLTISYHATSTAPTFMSLAHHSYFRLDNEADISAHELQIMAEQYLPVDDANLPTGEIATVANTAFDFRQQTAIGPRAFDHNFCLSSTTPSAIRPVARLFSPHSGIEMSIASDQPGLQFYTAHHLDERAPNHHGRPYRGFDGVCLEPQNWPNSPHMPHFPSSLLPKGAHYQQTLSLAFAHKGAM